MSGPYNLTPAQRMELHLSLAEADHMHASPRERKALVEALKVESNITNLPYGDRDSVGGLQQRPSQGWKHALDPAGAAHDFLVAARAANTGHGSAGQLAQAVQRSGFPGRYDEQSALADHLLGGSGGHVAGGTATSAPHAGTAHDGQDQAVIDSLLASPHLDHVGSSEGLLSSITGRLASGAYDTTSPTAHATTPTANGGHLSLGSDPSHGSVTIAPGANRAGAKLDPGTLDFLRHVASIAGHFTVGTGTNHKQFVYGEPGVQSRHWTGHAGDIPVPIDSARGDQIAAAALVAAGVPPSHAITMAHKGGVFNLTHDGRPVQVIWKSMVGGNHHNHVHVSFG